MKLYTPPEMSKKLVALGCKSQSRMYWCLRQGGPIYDAAGGVADYIEDSWVLLHSSRIDYDEEIYYPAFEFEDFAGPESNENLFKIVKQGDSILDKKYRISHASNWVEEVGRGL